VVEKLKADGINVSNKLAVPLMPLYIHQNFLSNAISALKSLFRSTLRSAFPSSTSLIDYPSLGRFTEYPVNSSLLDATGVISERATKDHMEWSSASQSYHVTKGCDERGSTRSNELMGYMMAGLRSGFGPFDFLTFVT
jgi:hypothetical protein